MAVPDLSFSEMNFLSKRVHHDSTRRHSNTVHERPLEKRRKQDILERRWEYSATAAAGRSSRVSELVRKAMPSDANGEKTQAGNGLPEGSSYPDMVHISSAGGWEDHIYQDQLRDSQLQDYVDGVLLNLHNTDAHVGGTERYQDLDDLKHLLEQQKRPWDLDDHRDNSTILASMVSPSPAAIDSHQNQDTSQPFNWLDGECRSDLRGHDDDGDLFFQVLEAAYDALVGQEAERMNDQASQVRPMNEDIRSDSGVRPEIYSEARGTLEPAATFLHPHSWDVSYMNDSYPLPSLDPTSEGLHVPSGFWRQNKLY